MPYSKNPATMYAILDELSKLKALDIDYDNLFSGLVSTKIQGAIDELSLLISGGTGSQDLDSVLTLGNNAGSNDIDLNGNDLLNVNNINLSTINGSAYPPTGSTIVDASGVTYDNISSGLVSTEVQGAIDELNTLISGITETQDLSAVLALGNSAGANDIDLNSNDLLNVNNINLNTINGAPYPPTGSTIVDASGVTYNNVTSGLVSTDVQGAIDELSTLVSGTTSGSDKGSFGASADGSTTGLVGYITMPYNGTITGWQVIGSETGSCSFDVWKTAAGIIPTVANSITGSEKPALTAQQINSDLNLTTWATTSIAVGDIIGISLDSASSLTSIWLTVFTTKLP